MKGIRVVVLGLVLALIIAPGRLVAQSLDELVQQGNAAQEAGNYAKSEGIWRQIIQRDPNNAYAYYKLCDVLDDQSKIPDAVLACRTSVQINPTSSKANFLLGYILAKQGKKEEAIAAFRKAIELDPKFAQAYNNLGVVLDDLGKKEDAIASYRQAIALDPKYTIAYNNLGDALYDQKKLEEAIAAYRQAIALDPKYATPYNGLGNALSDQGKLEEAIAAYRQAIKLDLKLTVAYINLGVALSDQGKLEEAIATYQKAIALDPKYANAYSGLGNALRDQGKLEEAIAAYRKAIALDPKYALPYNGLGNALSDQGKLEDAIAAYQKAIELDPKYASAYNNLGVALKDQGKLEDAIAAYQKALSLPDSKGSLTTTHTLAHNNLGRLLQNQGKLAEAISEFEKATQIDPKFEYAQNNLKEARRLLALKTQPTPLIALNETQYLPKDDPLTPLKRSIVKISVVFSGNAKGASYGTGYVIKRQGDKLWIITCRHVVIDKDTDQTGSNLEIEPYYGEKLPNLPRKRSPAKIVSVTKDGKLDLALLEVTGLPTDIQPLTIRLDKIEPGIAVMIIGHPDNHDWSKYDAKFMNIKQSSGNLLLDITLAAGSSGSPIFDQNRSVIGIMVRSVNESDTSSDAIGIAHPINSVIQQIAQWGVQIP